ncbi:10365_t:CDS:2, partial [Scutellospora calospora]
FLINHIMERHGEQLLKIDYVDTFQQLNLRCEQNKEIMIGPDKSPGESSQSNTRQTGRGGWSSAIGDEDEDAYFNTSDEEDNISNTSGECSKIVTTKQDVEPKEESTSDDELKPPVDSKEEPKPNIETVGLVDYPDEDDGDENVKKGIDELIVSDKQQTSISPPLSPKPIIGKRSRSNDDDDDDGLLL